MSTLSGRVRDYIQCATQQHGRLIFIITHPTCQVEDIVAVRDTFLQSTRFVQEFSPEAQKKLTAAWGHLAWYIPVVSDQAANTYLTYDQPEIEHDTSDLYILE